MPHKVDVKTIKDLCECPLNHSFTHRQSLLYKQTIIPLHTQTITPLHTEIITPLHTQTITPLHTQTITPLHTQTITPLHTYWFNHSLIYTDLITPLDTHPTLYTHTYLTISLFTYKYTLVYIYFIISRSWYLETEVLLDCVSTTCVLESLTRQYQYKNVFCRADNDVGMHYAFFQIEIRGLHASPAL